MARAVTSSDKIRILPKSNYAMNVANRIRIQNVFDEIITPELGSYFDLYKPDFDRNVWSCCPLHDEDTPSFKYYPETNSWYCFGCGAGGKDATSVDLYRLYVQAHQGMIISNDEAAKYLSQKLEQHMSTGVFRAEKELVLKGAKTINNSKEELMRFKVALSKFEIQLSHTKDKLVYDVYAKMDSVNLEVDRNIKTTENGIKEIIELAQSLNIKLTA